MKSIRLGIIGVGQIGKVHLKNYANIAGAEIVAAADVNEAELKRVAELHKIPNTYLDYRELLKRDDLAAVDVCLHNNLHAPVSIAAMEAGKDVYCEKPIAGAYADGQRMLDTAKATGRKLHIQLNTLFNMETRAAQELIRGGQVGHMYYARSSGFRRRGRPFVDGYGTSNFVKKAIAAGGALYDMGIYHIAQMLYLLQQPKALRISGKIFQETEMDAARRASSGYDVEELACGFVKFGGGLTLDIIESWAAHLDGFEGSFILGSKGGIRLAPFGYFSNLHDMEMLTTFNLDRASKRWHDIRENADVYDSSQHHWIAAHQGRVELMPTAQVALQTMLIQEGIYMSDRLGREVSADEVAAESKSKAIA
ncbi:MAG: Gfo/Idh/MocA family oxidoreductase [Candidatus Sumerlaeota bacterium]|nr:Gfo/Idh/MocA family oxidoreductase [Candidatus Sumerlaeota bacterium]